MIDRIKLNHLEEFFSPISNRIRKGVYFCRINSYSCEMEEFLMAYFKAAKKSGAIIENKLKNPDENQIQFYENKLGSHFKLDPLFIKNSLKAWLTNLSIIQTEILCEAIYGSLEKMRQSGKNENILKNAYIKYMCWFYYKFKIALDHIGNDNVPKICYMGEISLYEFHMLKILSGIGCDVVLVQLNGDTAYQKVDPAFAESEEYRSKDAVDFPKDFSFQLLQFKINEQEYLESLYDNNKIQNAGTNTWLTGELVSDSLKEHKSRGDQFNCFYNMFVRITGVEDKATYCKDLFHWKSALEDKKKTVIILDSIMLPTIEEVLKVAPGNYQSTDQMIAQLSLKIHSSNGILKNQVVKAFVDCIKNKSLEEAGNLNRLKNQAVYLVCWFNRYERLLSFNSAAKNMPVLLFFGTCKNKAEVLFIQFFASLPVDIIVINPDLNKECLLRDTRLFDRKYSNSMELDSFPLQIEDMSYGTVAYHAEQELNETLYKDSMLYRDRQFKRATIITLQTMYEELYLLWDQEVTVRPNFEVIGNKVVIPAIIAKISGVKGADFNSYWKDIKKLLVGESILITDIPFYKNTEASFLKSGMLSGNKINRAAIINSSKYNYGIFREEMQEYLLEKLQELLDSRIIQGTFINGAESRIIHVAMNLNKTIMRIIQKMDFTKKLPKLVLIHTGEVKYSLDDSIMLAFLHLIGFDIILFVPAGYMVVENYYTKNLFMEHQIGEFVYDVQVPDIMQEKRQEEQEGLIRRIFKRDK